MDLNEIRREIDGIDDEMLALFLRRMELAGQAAEHKRQHGLPVFQPEREREIISRMKQAAGDELGEYAAGFFTAVMALSKEYQQKI